jgi:RNA polymerase sigma-70 factor (ECF subfamily)
MPPPAESGRRGFPSTQWTDVLAARAANGDEARRHALSRLIHTYWKPAYFFLRRRGSDPEGARDLTQSFFAAFLERDYARHADRARGKFRIFLRTALDHHLSDERDRMRAQKRGGGVHHVSLDFGEAEREFASTACDDPEQLFRRKWALSVVQRALEVLRESYRVRGRGPEYDALVERLIEPARGGPTYAELAQRLGLSEIDVNNRLHRLRKQYRQAIWAELRDSTEDDAQAEEELRELLAALAS